MKGIPKKSEHYTDRFIVRILGSNSFGFWWRMLHVASDRFEYIDNMGLLGQETRNERLV